MKRPIFAILIFALSALGVAAQKAPAKKADTSSGSSMDLVVTHNGEKTEIKSVQYATHDGYVLKNPDGKFMIFFGAGSNGDGPSFTLSGQLNGSEPGTYAIGGENSRASFSLLATVLKGTTMLMPDGTGEMVITAFPQAGGVVAGTFHAMCQTITDAGEVDKYDVSGSFKLIRR